MSRTQIRIELTDFEDTRTVSRDLLATWFSTRVFDKRYPKEAFDRWLKTNARYLEFLGVTAWWSEDEKLVLSSSNKIGLVPLKNPIGRDVYGSLCVRPRVGMTTISDVLDKIDWQLRPQLLTEEAPIVADGTLPRWFRAVQTLVAIDRALNLRMTGLEHRREVRRTPGVGTDWNYYALSYYPRGKHDSFLCDTSARSFDLKIHRQFKGVAALIERDVTRLQVPNKVRRNAGEMLVRIGAKLESVTPEPPSVSVLLKTRVPSLYRHAYREAQARCVEYIQQGRITLSSGDLGGIPWSLDMEKLFETWIVTGAQRFARSIGADCYSDLKGTSRIRLLPLGRWHSQHLIKPDVIIEKEDKSLVIDAKYKRHLMHLVHGKSDAYVEADHRADLLQVLAYVGASSMPHKIAALVYPQSMADPVFEIARVVNYRNTTTNLLIVLVDVPFDWGGLLNTLKKIWQEAIKMTM